MSISGSVTENGLALTWALLKDWVSSSSTCVLTGFAAPSLPGAGDLLCRIWCVFCKSWAVLAGGSLDIYLMRELCHLVILWGYNEDRQLLREKGEYGEWEECHIWHLMFLIKMFQITLLRRTHGFCRKRLLLSKHFYPLIFIIKLEMSTPGKSVFLDI